MLRLKLRSIGLILLAGAACGFASTQTIDSAFPGARPIPEDVVEPLFPHISEAEAAIHRKLNEETSVNFDKLPSDEALDFISKTSDIPIILDLVSIEDTEFQLPADTPVSLQIRNTPLRSVLKNMLDPLELGYFVHDDVLKVTITVVACEAMTTGIYPVSDLVTDDTDSWEELVQLVPFEVDGLWEEIDGSGGTISMSRATKSLIIRQSLSGHGDVHRLLTFMRAAKRIGEERLKPPAKPNEKAGGFGGGGGGLF